MDYTGGYSTFSLARFGQRFVDQVANPKNLLLWYRKKAGTGLGRFNYKIVHDLHYISCYVFCSYLGCQGGEEPAAPYFLYELLELSPVFKILHVICMFFFNLQ